MGIFDFFSKDPAHSWGKASRQKLTLDLSRGTINHLMLGDPMDNLREYGKPSNEKAYKNELFMYKESGLIIGTDSNKIDSFGIILHNYEHYESFSKADLTITHPLSGAISVNSGMLRGYLIDKLNLEINETDADDVEIIDYANIFQYTLEIDSFADERIKRINFYKQLS
ncbi:hypothetical protein [Desulfoluna sp.]|uniref:hypothetical protein n=1 Tax=Desulfoluna sp. TaxID=2045199 RepID=UPI00261B8FFC|nr:hypothetical protein [Desulfoluna sp.]